MRAARMRSSSCLPYLACSEPLCYRSASFPPLHYALLPVAASALPKLPETWDFIPVCEFHISYLSTWLAVSVVATYTLFAALQLQRYCKSCTSCIPVKCNVPYLPFTCNFLGSIQSDPCKACMPTDSEDALLVLALFKLCITICVQWLYASIIH